MHYINKQNQFNYIMSRVVRAVNCDLSFYLTLDKVKENNSENNTHITTDKPRNQMKE